MSVDAEGFVSPDVGQAIVKVRQQHAKWFAFADKLNRYCQRILWSVEVKLSADEDCTKRLIAAALFTRCVSNYQAILILSERGMYLEARSIARTALEAAFVLAALYRDESFLGDYFKDDFLQKRKLLRKYVKLASLVEMSPEFVEIARGQLSEIEERIRSESIKLTRTLSTERIAERGAMLPLYLSMYSVLSQTVHSIARDLDQHFGKDANGDIDCLNWAPGIEQIHEVLATACDIVFTATMYAMGLLERGSKEEYDALWDEWLAVRGLNSEGIPIDRVVAQP
jgi:hypothetical protein